MKKALFIAVSVLFIAVVIGGMFLYNRPLGQALELTIPESLAQSQDSQPQQSNDKTCGDSGVMKLISLGQASPMDDGHYGADAVRLIWVDFDDPAVVFLAIPSDLWVDSAALEDPGLDVLPLNEVYQIAYDEANSNNPDVRTRKATQVLAQTVLDNYEFVPDQYLTIQQDAFVDLVDEADIAVDVPYDITVVPEGWHTFEAGLQTMDGDQALDYVRILMASRTQLSYTDLEERFDRQDQVLWALLDSVLQTENWDNLPEIVKLARKMVVTDLSVKQANSLACMLKEANGKIDSVQLPGEIVYFDGDGNMFTDPQNVLDVITEIEDSLGAQ